LWALLNFLVPDVFANAEQFDEWFNLDIEDDAEKNRLISQLHKILRPFMLRRLKKEVEKSLPPKHETILYTGMSAMQKKLYRDILVRDINALQGSSGTQTAILNIVMQLRKCAGHPYLFPGAEDRSLPPLGEHLVENCGKMVLLDKLLKRLKERGHRVLLFTQMTRILDILEDYLVMRRYQYCRIDGNTSQDLREDYINSFNAPNSEKFIFLLSTRAGGLGINLQTADVVILYDSDWNPQADLQAQDRAHRIGQKREVQVFRFVTEHTVEEKIVERAQQKLKLDAMVVQQGRLKGKDKLSRDELLSAVRFGADKIFKSKDSSITDEDIDIILGAGKKKTQELNDKLQNADMGDLLDFKLDGSSNLQTFEGIDYSGGALAAAKAEAELLNIIDMGKRERKTVANYNENKLYQQQVAAMQGGVVKERKKKKAIRLPKTLRLPRMEEWQMFNRGRLIAIQEEEEKIFRALPEEVQKMATAKKQETVEKVEADTSAEVPVGEESKEEANKEGSTPSEPVEPVELPPLLDEDTQAEKEMCLSEGFVQWSRSHYSVFVKASARHGRTELAKIALELGKSEEDVQKFANAFWGNLGKERFSEHEYDRVVKLIEKGERKINEIKSLERGTRILISLFDNPWEELEFTHVNTKDKLFSPDNDRYLLCWTHKYGYGEWGAIKMAVRRSPKFRFDYFIRSLPIDVIGRRCEHLMRAAEKEVEQMELKAREAAGLPVEAEEGSELPPIELPSYRDMQHKLRATKKQETEKERQQLEQKVEEIESQIKETQERLKELSKDPIPEDKDNLARNGAFPIKRPRPEEETPEAAEAPDVDESLGALDPDGEFVDFPEYDGSEPPKEAKKPFTQFCVNNRKEVKASLDPENRKNKRMINEILREQWLELPDDEKLTWRAWSTWDKKRFARDTAVYEKAQSSNNNDTQEETTPELHVPKKRIAADDSFAHIPKKKR
jgi:SWI/SNF-related matrix-associated actin-dependent regulator of chromatin subfamily A member 5